MASSKNACPALIPSLDAKGRPSFQKPRRRLDLPPERNGAGCCCGRQLEYETCCAIACATSLCSREDVAKVAVVSFPPRDADRWVRKRCAEMRTIAGTHY